MTRTLPCICFVEDDLDKQENLAYDHAELFASVFDLRFVTCEQHFWDAFGGRRKESYRNQLIIPSDHSNIMLYDAGRDVTPSVMVIDMMVEWKSIIYDSGRQRPKNYTVNRAGIRIGHQLIAFAKNASQRIHWFYWAANSCEHLRSQLPPVELCYKDSLQSEEILRKVSKLVHRAPR